MKGVFTNTFYLANKPVFTSIAPYSFVRRKQHMDVVRIAASPTVCSSIKLHFYMVEMVLNVSFTFCLQLYIIPLWSNMAFINLI